MSKLRSVLLAAAALGALALWLRERTRREAAAQLRDREAERPPPGAERQLLIERLAELVDAQGRDLAASAEAARADAELSLREAGQHVSDAERERADARRERDYWRSQASDLEARVTDLDKVHEQQIKALAEQLHGHPPGMPGDAIHAVGIASVTQAVELAGQRFPSLRFLQEARDSAAASTYRDPGKVYTAFEALADLAEVRMTGPLGKSVKDWLGERGFAYAAHESQTTMGMYGDERTFRYGGAKITMEEHIKFGVGPDPRLHLRIHLMWHPGESRWLIGHVGRHLTNTKT